MARKPRFHKSGAFYHVIIRGNNGQRIFFSDMDQWRLCLIIQEGIERFGHRIHGFCFMQNHIHLILQTSDVLISRVIQHLSFRYARYINRKENRIGHLFQGRFKSLLVDDNQYLLELVRYVHLNPIRAGICIKPEDYVWSSHRAYLGLDHICWLTVEWILLKFHPQEITAKNYYQAHILRKVKSAEENIDCSRGSHEGRFLGSDDFVKKLKEDYQQQKKTQKTWSLIDLVEIVCLELHFPKSLISSPQKDHLITKVRGVLAHVVLETKHYTLKALSEYVNRDPSSMSRLAKDIPKKLMSDPTLAFHVANIIEKLNQR